MTKRTGNSRNSRKISPGGDSGMAGGRLARCSSSPWGYDPGNRTPSM